MTYADPFWHPAPQNINAAPKQTNEETKQINASCNERERSIPYGRLRRIYFLGGAWEGLFDPICRASGTFWNVPNNSGQV